MTFELRWLVSEYEEQVPNRVGCEPLIGGGTHTVRCAKRTLQYRELKFHDVHGVVDTGWIDVPEVKGE